MGEVVLVFFVILIYGLINFLGGIFVRKTIIDKNRGEWFLCLFHTKFY